MEINNAEFAWNVAFKNMDASDSLKDYAKKKFGTCFNKYISALSSADMVFKVEGKRQIAEITFNYDGSTFKDTEETEDMYKSVDSLVDSISAQLRKNKEKQTSHH